MSNKSTLLNEENNYYQCMLCKCVLHKTKFGNLLRSRLTDMISVYHKDCRHRKLKLIDKQLLDLLYEK